MKLKKPSKYRNVRTKVDGITFDSKKEATHYQELKLLMKAGEVQWFCRQVSFDLPGGIKYKADFVVVRVGQIMKPALGTSLNCCVGTTFDVVVEDVKAWNKKTRKFILTDSFKLKQKLMRSTYGIEIRLV